MKATLCGFLLVATTTCCLANEVIQWPGDTMTLGGGFDKLTGEIKMLCVDRPTIQRVGGEDLDYVFTSLENEQSASRITNLSLSARYGAGKAKASLLNQVNFNRFSAYQFISIKVISRTDSLVKNGYPVLRAQHSDLLKANPVRFRELCGSHFMATQALGGEYTAVIEVKTSSEAERREVQAKVSGGGMSFKLSVEASDKVATLTSNRSTKVTVARSGGYGSIKTSLDELQAAIREFPQDLRGRQDGDLQAASGSLIAYVDLELPGSFDRSIFADREKLVFVEDASEFVIKVRGARGDAEYALANPDEFGSLDIPKLRAFLVESDRTIRSVEWSIDDCIRPAQRQCGVFSPPKLELASVPDRKVETKEVSRAELVSRIQKARDQLNHLGGKKAIEHRCRQYGLGTNLSGVSGCVGGQLELMKLCSSNGCSASVE